MTYLMIFIIAVLQLVDALLTLRILAAGGKELNRFLAYLFDRFGALFSLCMIKGSLIVILLVATPKLEKWDFFIPAPNPMLVLYSGIILLYLLIVAHNIYQLKRKDHD